MGGFEYEESIGRAEEVGADYYDAPPMSRSHETFQDAGVGFDSGEGAGEFDGAGEVYEEGSAEIDAELESAARVQPEYDELVERSESLNEVLREVQAELLQASEENDVIRARNEALEVSLQQINEWRRDQGNREEAARRIQEENEELQEDVQMMRKELADLSAARASDEVRYKQELESVLANKDESSSDMAERHDSIVHDLQESVAELQLELEAVRNQREELAQTSEVNDRLLLGKEREIADLRERFEEMAVQEHELARLEAALQSKEVEIAKYQEIEESLLQEKRAFEDRVRSEFANQGSSSELLMEIDHLKQQLEEANKAKRTVADPAAATSDGNDPSELKIQELEEALQMTEEERDLIIESQKRAQDELQVLRQERDGIMNIVNEYVSEPIPQTAELLGVKLLIESIQAGIRRTEIEDTSKIPSDRSSEIEGLLEIERTELSKLRQLHVELEARYSEMQEQNRSLAAKLKVMERTVDQQLSSAKNEETSKFEEVIAELEEDMEMSRGQLMKERNLRQEAERVLENLKLNNRTLNDKLREANHHIEELSEKVLVMDEKAFHTEEELHELKATTIESYQDKEAHMMQELQLLRLKLADTEAKMAKATYEIASMKPEFLSTKERLQETELMCDIQTQSSLNLQRVLEEFQESKDREIEQSTQVLKKEIQLLSEKIETLETELKEAKDETSSVRRALQEVESDLLNNRIELETLREQQLEMSHGVQALENQNNSEPTVDPENVKSLLLQISDGMTEEDRLTALASMSEVLGFTEEERVR